MESLLIEDLAKLLNMNISDINKSLNLNTHNYWDSLAIVSIIGSIDNYYNVRVSGVDLAAVKTVNDIFTLIKNKMI